MQLYIYLYIQNAQENKSLREATVFLQISWANGQEDIFMMTVYSNGVEIVAWNCMISLQREDKVSFSQIFWRNTET